jgi:ubiquinone/menaquinone biosynthesis C-methylase UbiE
MHILEIDIEKVRERVRLMHEDVLQCDFPENSFDLIYSRDAILHIRDKQEIYYKFMVNLTGSIL